MTTKITITRQQYEKIKDIFEKNPEVAEIKWTETAESGIGPTITVTATVNKVWDLTDVDSW